MDTEALKKTLFAARAVTAMMNWGMSQTAANAALADILKDDNLEDKTIPINLLNCPESEYSADFLQGMINRMTVSYYKYGKVADAYPKSFNALESLHLRVQSYLETRNTEFLIDAANFAMIEFEHPSIDGAHYTPTDSDESPGRVNWHGSVTHEGNNAIRDRLYKRDGD